MSIPSIVRDRIREQLWREADSHNWLRMSLPDKSRKYDDWVVRDDVGDVLSRYMDAREVRVYLKDTVMKTYAQQRLKSHERSFRVLGLDENAAVAEEYMKPNGRRLIDGRIVCWGLANNWKAILMAIFERSRADNLQSFGAVLSGATGRYRNQSIREMVEDAATRLGIERVVWLED